MDHHETDESNNSSSSPFSFAIDADDDVEDSNNNQNSPPLTPALQQQQRQSPSSGAPTPSSPLPHPPHQEKKGSAKADRLSKLKRVKPANASSPVWMYFKKYAGNLNQNLVICEICVDEVVVGDNGSTTNMTAHLKSKHKKEHQELLSARLKSKHNINNEKGVMMAFVSGAGEANFVDQLLKWIVKTRQPFTVTESPHFINMISAAKKQGAVLPAKKTLEDRLLEIEVSVQQECFHVIGDNWVAITSDIWTSVTQDSYMSLTGHFINKDWTLVSLSLECTPFNGSHTGDRIAEMIRNLLNKHKLKVTRVSAFVSDTCANVKKAGRQLPFPWIGCANHILELTAGIFLESKEVSPVVAACRRYATHFKKSGGALDGLRLACEYKKVKFKKVLQDVSTRWWSTFTAFQRLLDLEAPLKMMAAGGDLKLAPEQQLSEVDWEIIRFCCNNVLKYFTACETLLEGTKYITISCVPMLIRMLRNDIKQALFTAESAVGGASVSDRAAATLVEPLRAMTTDFETRWGTGENQLEELPKQLVFAEALDPRTAAFASSSGRDSEGRDVWDLISDYIVQQLEQDEEAARKKDIIANAAAGGDAAASAALARKKRDHEDLIPDDGITGASTTEEGVESWKRNPKKKPKIDSYKDIWDRAHAASSSSSPSLLAAAENDDAVRSDVEDDDENSEKTLAAEIRRQQVLHEVKLYRAAASLHREKDPLKWWKSKSKNLLPNIGALARSILAIPATSAPSERLLSSAGLTVTKKRNSLGGSKVSTLCFLEGSWELAEESQKMRLNKGGRK